jgi:hypothetical protein
MRRIILGLLAVVGRPINGFIDLSSTGLEAP